MTLLLNLIGPTGIHLSSDYRLTDLTTQQPIEDILGSKQLEFLFSKWTAQISFTGIAEVRGQKTRDWISETLSSAPQAADISSVVAGLATRATNQLRGVPSGFRKLTIVVTASEAGRPPQLFVLSCVDRPNGPPLTRALDQFAVYEISSDRPQVLIFGFTSAVSPPDRKLLKNLSRSGRDPAEIRAALAEINSRSAKRSSGLISAGCLVTTVLAGGTSASENFGRTPGIPPHMVGSAEIAELIAKSMPGKRPTFVQSRGVRGEATNELTTAPMNVSEGSTLIVKVQGERGVLFVTDALGNTFTQMPRPLGPGAYAEDEEVEWEQSQLGVEIGEPRTIEFSSPTSSAPITAADGSRVGLITIGGVTGTVTLRKNQLARAVLNTITAQIDPSAEYDGHPISLLLQIPNIPTVDGIQPRSWTYAIDVRIDGTYSFSIRRNSMAFRSQNYKSPMPLLASSEELAMAAPRNPSVLRVGTDNPTASANIEARFPLRDCREPTPSIIRASTPRPVAKVGRNSPCPCGSGKKYKKCCLGRAV